VIARGEVDVVVRVAAGGGSHVLRVERILEREDDPIHRHLLEIRIASIGGVELCRALEGVRKPAEHLAHRGRAGRERSRGRMPVEVAPAGDRALPPNVEGSERIHWPASGVPTIIPNCCWHGRIGAVVSMRPYSRAGPRYLSRSGRIVDALTVFVGKRSGAVARRSRSLRGRGTVFRDEEAGHPVVGAGALDVVLDERDAGHLP
jgi:hypothetical protein